MDAGEQFLVSSILLIVVLEFKCDHNTRNVVAMHAQTFGDVVLYIVCEHLSLKLATLLSLTD